ncbi:hypothetical protein [Pseudokineococcus sp. 1T1Z-3]|uniref:hypothetical protein n=1 Tax=Pseudokineococcus sp. 1T1Z-3 TaxID=3132745 RepID=UPI0030D891EB
MSTTKNSATIWVNGKKFSVTRDDAAKTITRNGYGNALDGADVLALEALAENFNQQYVANSRTTRAGKDHVDLLVRYVALLSSAPVGTRIDSKTMPEPNMTLVSPATIESELAAVAACDNAKELAAGAAKDGEAAATTAAACQRTDEDGILYMSCTRAKRSLYYDAVSPKRCWSRDVVTSGPGSSGSLGECGPADNGIDTYTYDCGEHDRCGRVYGGSLNPWDRNCGDEFFEAEDDFLFAPINRC